jgi:hypothetical protein
MKRLAFPFYVSLVNIGWVLSESTLHTGQCFGLAKHFYLNRWILRTVTKLFGQLIWETSEARVSAAFHNLTVTTSLKVASDIDIYGTDSDCAILSNDGFAFVRCSHCGGVRLGGTRSLNFRCRRPAELSEEPPMTSAFPFRSQQLGTCHVLKKTKHAVAADVERAVRSVCTSG